MFGANGTNDSNPTAGPRVQAVLETLTSSSTTETADVYFSAIVQQINTTTGQVSDATLPNNSQLSVSVAYTTNNNVGTEETDSTQNDPSLGFSAGTTQPDPPDVTPTLPTLSYAPYQATFNGQSSTTGYASISINGLPSGSTLTNVQLSDAAGLGWTVGSTYGRTELGLQPISYTTSGGTTQATITFPPDRNEAGSTMTLSYQLSGSPTEYLTDIAVPSGTTG